MTDPAVSDETAKPDEVVLAWWHSPINLVAVGLAIVLLCGALGYVIGNNRAIDDPNSTDVGFLQDMRFHHEQAVQLSFIFLNTPDTDQDLRTVARDILVGQNIEIGRMIQLLRTFGKPEVNESDIAMSWMDAPVALERMPGLATEGDIDQLVTATGADSDEIFVRLMVAHHEGGVHMADYTAVHAATAEVRLMAGQFAAGQREEVAELERLLVSSRS